LANKLTQSDIAKHLDLDQSAVSRLLEKLGLNAQTSALEEIRIAYVRHLRMMAAGHRSKDGDDLVSERVLTERVDRQLKELTLAEKRGLLINVSQLEPELMQMVGAFRTELLSRDDKLKTELDALYGIDIDLTILNDHTHAALTQLARYDVGNSGAIGSARPVDDATGTDDDNSMGDEIP